MDTKKLDKWAELLLDTGKRNNLINFKDTKASTVEVLLPSADMLFDKIDGATAFEVFDPKIAEDDDEIEDTPVGEQLQIDESETRDDKAAYLAQYSNKIKRQSQVLLYNSATNLITAVKNIDKKAREFIEETGVNVAYMAFGFIHWKESESSSYIFRAPILLIPIQLEQTSAVEPYYIKSADDDIIVNPTFAYKLDAEHGVKLPDYDDEGLTAYLEKVKKIVSKLQWDVSAECKIGIFSFLKINMYRDLKDNASTILSNPNVRQLLGEPVNDSNVDGDSNGAVSVTDPLIELHSPAHSRDMRRSARPALHRKRQAALYIPVSWCSRFRCRPLRCSAERKFPETLSPRSRCPVHSTRKDRSRGSAGNNHRQGPASAEQTVRFRPSSLLLRYRTASVRGCKPQWAHLSCEGAEPRRRWIARLQVR